MKYIVCGLLLFLTITGKSQSYNIDGSIGTDSKNTLFLYNINPAIGYSFIDRDYFSFGFKFQTYSFIPKLDRNKDDLWSTTTIMNFMFYTGTRYLIPLVKIHRNKENENTIGFYPEIKMYFNPYVPNTIKYIDNNELEIKRKGKYSTQLAYGIGFGLYFERKDYGRYLAISFEYSSIDAFKELRKLEYPNKHFDFPTQRQFSIGFSVFIW